MEPQLEKTLLLMFRQRSEYLSSIQQMVLGVKLVDIVRQQWQVEQKAKPITIN